MVIPLHCIAYVLCDWLMHLTIGLGDVAALVRSLINGLQPFDSTIEQTVNRNNAPSHKTLTAAIMIQKQLTTVATGY